jgi:hypothetical protein
LLNLTTSLNVPYEVQAYSFDAGTNTVHYTFPGLPGGVLPAGSYRATLSDATDQAGNLMLGSVTYYFIWSPGTSGPDTFRIAINAAGTLDQVYQNDDVTPAFSADYSSLNLIALAGGEADDSFVVDTSNGNPYAASGIVLDGGNGADSLRVSVTDLVDNVAFQTGAAVIDGGQVAHSGIEQFAYTGSVEHYVTLAVDAGSVTVNGTDRFELLSIATGAAVIVQPGNSSGVVARGLSIAGTGVLDLTNNGLVLPNGTVPAVQALLAAGSNLGNWDGAGGINSSTAAANPAHITALGFADNAVLHRTVFAGVSGLAGTEILVKYTYYGDSDLDGRTTLDDFTLFLFGYQHGSSAWSQGNYDYSGVVTLDDFTLFLKGYQQQGPQL